MTAVPLPQPRPGEPLKVKDRPLEFSFFPVRRTSRRYGLQDVVFAVDPWAVIQGAVNDRVPASHLAEASAFIEQARTFYDAARARSAASPLLSYYAFLNLGKALIRCLGFTGSLEKARHGLSETRTGTGSGMAYSTINVHDDGNQVNIFPEVIERLGYPRPAIASVPVLDLAPQVVVGHRLWREASGRTERFFALADLEFVHDPTAKTLWLRLWQERGDLSRYGITRRQLLTEGQLPYREVDSKPLGRTPSLLCLEQQTPLEYTGRPTDIVHDLVATCRPWLWRIITASAEGSYRRYYVHLTPTQDQFRMPQIASIWMLIFYLGSVVRYRPQTFDSITAGTYGAWVSDFVAAQPEQLLFMLASEMREREVARPAIV